MSRIGKKTIAIPEKVTVKVADGMVAVQGPLGLLKQVIPPTVTVTADAKSVKVSPANDEAAAKSQYGMYRTIVANMVDGVTKGFNRELDIIGVGYRAETKGKELHLSLGFSHPVIFPFPDGITIKVDKQTHLVITGANKELVGETAAKIRRVRPPEPYKGKGVRYANEFVRKKVGKAAATGSGAK